MRRINRRGMLQYGAAALALTATGLRAQTRLTVVATTGMIADAVRQVGGDLVAVTALMGPGVDPHTYRQTRSDIAAMAGADAVFWHGLYLEAQLEDFLLRLADQRPVTALADALPRDRLIASPDYPDRFDPHVWMVPDLWSGVVDAAQAALTALLPAAADTLAAQAAAHQADLARLAGYATQVLATVPEPARVLVTAHDAFGYFGRAYGFEVLGIQGISTESEAGLARIEELVALLVDRGIGAIFVESSVSERNVMALIEGAAARGHAVTIGGQLFSDAMGAPGSYEGTWLGMIDHNVTTIARALGGSAPAGGMDGRLGA